MASPCTPFGGSQCSRRESRRRQIACLNWVDSQLFSLLSAFMPCILACADHGDCWGEDELWEHGISHPSTLTVPLLMRLGDSMLALTLFPMHLVLMSNCIFYFICFSCI